MARYSCIAIVSFIFYATLAGGAEAETDRETLRETLQQRYEKVIFVGEIDHIEYAKLLPCYYTGPACLSSYLNELAITATKETGVKVDKSKIYGMLTGKHNFTIIAGKHVCVDIVTYKHWEYIEYPKLNLFNLTRGKIRVPLPGTHEFYIAIGKKKKDSAIALNPLSDLPSRFRAVGDWAARNGFATGFPNYEEAVYSGNHVFGSFLMRSNVAEWRDIPVVELKLHEKDVESPAGRFRAVNRWANKNGYRCGFPNFHEAWHNGLRVFGCCLIKAEHVEWRIFSEDEIDNSAAFHARIRGVSAWADKHGYATGFPNGEEAIVNGKRVFGAFLIKKGKAIHRDISVSDLR